MFQEVRCICVPFTPNFNMHPSESTVIGMYVHVIGGDPIILNWSHPDKPISDITLDSIRISENSLVYDKKVLAYNGIIGGMDLNSYLHYYIDDFIAPTDFYSKTMEHYYQRHRSYHDVNKVIPLSKLVEFAQGIVAYTLPYIESIPTNSKEHCKEYCDDFFNVFHSIERYDIHVDDHIQKQNYMWYTATSRPSNSWNNFNIAALNKSDGTRDAIHSMFDGGKLVQYDYDAFHVKLLANIVGYTFTKHPYLQIKEDLNLDIPYDEVKSKVFQNLYGQILPEFRKHPFFEKVQTFIDNLYQGYLKTGYVESMIYGKRFTDISNPSPNKVFNYVLQSLETEYNLSKLSSLLPMLAGQKTVLGMYLYDAFIFDVAPDEFHLIPLLTEHFETDSMTVKLSIGDTFGSMNQSLFDIYFKGERDM